MKILLTGPTGFIGAAFARAALLRGHQIAGLAVPGESLPRDLSTHPGVTWLRGTLQDAPWSDITAFQPQTCVHTAWITTPGVYLESPHNEAFRDASLGFITRLRDLGVGHVLSLGTCIEYQLSDQPLSETITPTQPTTLYARCKDQLRQALEALAARSGLGVCWARVFYPYGPGEHPSRLCSSLLRQIAAGQKVLLKTPDSRKDYIYIGDLAAALAVVVEKKFRGPINLGTGSGVAVRQIAAYLGRSLGKEDLIDIQNPPAPDPFPSVVADASRLKSLGWRQAWSLEQGLDILIKNLR